MNKSGVDSLGRVKQHLMNAGPGVFKMNEDGSFEFIPDKNRKKTHKKKFDHDDDYSEAGSEVEVY